MNDYRRYLDPNTIARLSNIELKARLVVEGFITGLHRSPYHGFSVEFAEHRQYRNGDEFRHIDWKVFGRTDKYYVKQFEEETNLRSMIAIDSSASMKFASGGNITKFEYAAYLAAALSYMLIKQRDAVGLSIYDTEIKHFIHPSSRQSHIHNILKTIDNVVPANQTGTAAALDSLAERIRRRGLVVLISDFFDDLKSIISALQHFRYKKHEVLVFQILDPREIDFKFGKNAIFKDMESGEEITTQPYQLQKAYAQTMQEFIYEIKKSCRNANIDYNLITTAEPFDKAMKEFIAKRNQMM